jgi:hypothetical protein
MTEEQLDEIVAMLRACHADAVESEGDYYADQFSFRGGGEAADAIEWLRREVLRLRLTDSERQAIAAGLGALERLYEDSPPISRPICEQYAPTLRGLLDRTRG